MQRNLHPHRYRETMSSALRRVEKIAASDAAAANLAVEFNGMSEAELTSRRLSLNHIETLIAKWVDDGCAVYDVDAILGSVIEGNCGVFELEAGLFKGITFVHFGRFEWLQTGAPSDEFVEGLYLQEKQHGGIEILELTFVCGGQAWDGLEDGIYRDALRIASRIAVCTIPNGKTLPSGMTGVAFSGDTELVVDGALRRAADAACRVIAILSTRGKLTQSPSAVETH